MRLWQYSTFVFGFQIILFFCLTFFQAGGFYLGVYRPFIELSIWISGKTGEAAMIVPPVLGILLGLTTYSLIGGVTLKHLAKRLSQKRD